MAIGNGNGNDPKDATALALLPIDEATPPVEFYGHSDPVRADLDFIRVEIIALNGRMASLEAGQQRAFLSINKHLADNGELLRQVLERIGAVLS